MPKQLKWVVLAVLVLLIFIGTGIYRKTSRNAVISTSGSGGIVNIHIQPLCNISEISSITLRAKEDTTFHKTRWINIGTQPGQGKRDYSFFWNTIKCHNSPYILEADIQLKNSTLNATSTMDITNLAIEKCVPESTFVIENEKIQPKIEIYVADNDVRDPMDISVRIYVLEDHIRPVRIINLSGVKGKKQVVWINLRNKKGFSFTPGVYTFDVTVKQTDSSVYGGKRLTIADKCSYRSDKLFLNPVGNLLYLNYINTKGSKTRFIPFDDAEVYSSDIQLKDLKGRNASGGYIMLYDYNYRKFREYDVEELECDEHKNSDSLNASKKGIHHEILFDVPMKNRLSCSALEFLDGHAAEYRDHQPHRTLNF